MKKELEKSCLIALRDYLGLQKEETLLIISDEVEKEIGYSLFEIGKKLCKEAIYVEMKSRQMNGEEPPQQIADLMKMFDVIVCPTAKSLTHTNARREAVKMGARVATMPGISKSTMIRCLSADANKVVELTNSVKNAIENAKVIRVIAKNGTDIEMNIEGRKILPSTGVLRNKGESGNLPSGEVYMAPVEGSANGVIVFDGSMAGIGILKNPIKVVVKNGYAEKIIGKSEAKKFQKMLDKVGKDARAIAEFGIGTNYKAKIIGQILEDEKVLGTIHIAFGNNVSMGGKINVPIHLDGLVKKPTVLIDDVVIMESGDLLI
ncbi:MAG: aminopeptidase [Ignavibacteria bacterium]